MAATELIEALKKCDVLASASDDDLQWLADAAQVDSYEADQVVFLEGEASTRVYIVARGSLQVRSGESCKLVSFAEAGSLFGEYAMFAKGVRSANVVAAEPSLLLSFGDEEFRDFLLRCPTVMMQLLETAVRRLHRMGRHRS